MKDLQYRVLLDLMMEVDPWPLKEEGKIVFQHLMLNEAKKRGYDDEIQAYKHFQGEHKLPKKSRSTEKRKPRKKRGQVK